MGSKFSWDSDIVMTITIDPAHWRRVRDIAMLLFGYPLYLAMHHGIRWYKKIDAYYKNVAEPFLIRLILRIIGIFVLVIVLAVLALGIWAHYMEGGVQ